MTILALKRALIPPINCLHMDSASMPNEAKIKFKNELELRKHRARLSRIGISSKPKYDMDTGKLYLIVEKTVPLVRRKTHERTY